MRREAAILALGAHRDELRRHHVAALFLFGSVARDEAAAGSDVDVLVEFDRPVGLFAFLRLQEYLEGLLGARVDLATPDALHPDMRERILAESIRAA